MANTPLEDRHARLLAFAKDLDDWTFDDTTAEQARNLRSAATHCKNAAADIGLFLAEDAKLKAGR